MPLIDPVALHRFSQQLLADRGMSPDDALTVADSLDWADRRGIASHGVAFLPRYLEFIKAGDLDPKARPAVISRPPGPWVVDAHRAAGAIAMRAALDTAFEALNESATAMVWIRQMTHCGAMGQYLEGAVRRGALAIAWTAGQPLMAYHGTGTAAVTTGPLVMAAPGPGGEPIVLDMATSDISFSRLRQAQRQGKTLPPGAALDAQGAPTTDPAQAVTPLPIAGPKGSGLALMFELMTGLMVGNPILEPFLNAEGRKRHGQNAMLMLIRIESFGALSSHYASDVDALVRTLKSLARAQGATEVLMPGERRARAHALTQAQGRVEVNGLIWKDLCERAIAAGIAVPATD